MRKKEVNCPICARPHLSRGRHICQRYRKGLSRKRRTDRANGAVGKKQLGLFPKERKPWRSR